MICSNCETKKYVWCLPSYHIIRHLTTQYLHNYIYQIWCMYSLFVVRFLFCIKNSYKNIVTEVYYFLLLSNRACECMYLCILNSDCYIIDYDMYYGVSQNLGIFHFGSLQIWKPIWKLRLYELSWLWTVTNLWSALIVIDGLQKQNNCEWVSSSPFLLPFH